MKTYNNILKQFKNQKVLVIGEMMLDCYFSGTSHRLSREAPVPIVDIDKKADVPGGAANTALNTAALGGQTSFLSVCGKDYEAERIMEQLWEKEIDVSGVYFDSERETIAKKRIISDDQLLVRYDSGTQEDILRDTEIRIIHYLDQNFKKYNAVILSDYSYGIFTNRIIHLIASLQNKYHTTLLVDSKNIAKFKSIDMTAVKPNYQQTVELLGLSPQHKNRVNQIKKQGTRIFEKVNTHIAACTVDVDGSVIFEKGKKPFLTKTKPQPNSQAAGAGDTFISAFALALSAGASTKDASAIASRAAEIVVQRTGTTQCTLLELQKELTPKKKVIRNNDLLHSVIEQYKNEKKHIVFTNGCFDTVHSGHVEFLKEAKQNGDILIVGLNSDRSVEGVTGESPNHSLNERIEVLKELNIIDHIVPFSEAIPFELIEIIQPDVFVKGGDYQIGEVPERKTVEKYGGQVKILSFYPIPDKDKRNITDVEKKFLNSFSFNHFLL